MTRKRRPVGLENVTEGRETPDPDEHSGPGPSNTGNRGAGTETGAQLDTTKVVMARGDGDV